MNMTQERWSAMPEHERAKVRSDAGLAHIAHLGTLGPGDSLVQVRVIKDDEGSVATKFH